MSYVIMVARYGPLWAPHKSIDNLSEVKQRSSNAGLIFLISRQYVYSFYYNAISDWQFESVDFLI